MKSPQSIADAAQGTAGQPKPTDVDAMWLANATVVPQIEPGQMATQDHMENRVAVETDLASGRVAAARCGQQRVFPLTRFSHSRMKASPVTPLYGLHGDISAPNEQSYRRLQGGGQDSQPPMEWHHR
ncbi:I78 family peptidase inhibitor [Pseudorhizobium pelagicum]|uniref:I78 family peptidase inhibitor n=1 Tax=Pseudorhizobium pelagicum TaxID=1509405 RepID=UPI0009E07034|nr:I78 family peptidase inhibitor [Pseudorhizobium pelagicum]